MRLIFDNPRFRLLWISGLVNNLGLILYFTSHGWLALTVSDSAFWVGFTAGVGGIGLFTFSIFGGVLADRFDRRKLIVVSNALQATVAFSIAALIFTDQIVLWHVMIAALFDGMIVAVKIPSRMALTLDVAGRERLLSATAANMASMTAMGIVAPLLGGFIIGRFGIQWPYVIMGSSFVIAGSMIFWLRGIPRLARTTSTAWQDLKSGVRYVFTKPAVRTLILMGVTSELFGWAHETMMPVMARDVLNAGPEGLGYLLAAGSVGGLISTLIISSRADVKNKGRLLVLGYGGFGVFLIAFAFSPWLVLSLFLIAGAYAGVMAYESALGTLLQTTASDEMRGRVLSFQILTWGMTGVSGFHTGAIAAALGAPVAIAAGGSVLALNAARLVRRTAGFEQRQPEAAVGD